MIVVILNAVRIIQLLYSHKKMSYIIALGQLYVTKSRLYIYTHMCVYIQVASLVRFF